MKPLRVTNAINAKVPGTSRTTKETNIWAVIDGRKCARVTVPKVHAGEIKTGTLNSIRKQLLLSHHEFERFVYCTMSAQEYEDHLRAMIAAGTL